MAHCLGLQIVVFFFSEKRSYAARSFGGLGLLSRCSKALIVAAYVCKDKYQGA